MQQVGGRREMEEASGQLRRWSFVTQPGGVLRSFPFDDLFPEPVHWGRTPVVLARYQRPVNVHQNGFVGSTGERNCMTERAMQSRSHRRNDLPIAQRPDRLHRLVQRRRRHEQIQVAHRASADSGVERQRQCGSFQDDRRSIGGKDLVKHGKKDRQFSIAKCVRCQGDGVASAKLPVKLVRQLGPFRHRKAVRERRREVFPLGARYQRLPLLLGPLGVAARLRLAGEQSTQISDELGLSVLWHRTWVQEP